MPRRVAILVAVATFLFGFGALALLSLVFPGPEGLRGLFSYWSATLGDAVLLPGLVFCLMRVATRSWSGTAAQLIALAGGTTVGLAAGATLQWSWLVDPSPVLNWTLPKPGHFTFAGWYHAGFLTIMCAVFGGLVLVILVNARRTPLGRDDARLLVIGACLAIAFSALLAVDNLAGPSAASTWSTLGAVAVAAGLVAATAGAVALRGRSQKRPARGGDRDE